MSEVRRWQATQRIMAEHARGAFVRADDYDALAARVAELEARNARQADELGVAHKTITHLILEGVKAQVQRDRAIAQGTIYREALERIGHRDRSELDAARTLHYDMAGWAQEALAAAVRAVTRAGTQGEAPPHATQREETR